MVVQNNESNLMAPQCQIEPERKHRLRQRFQVVKKLGQGTYGKVQLAINKETRQEVAIKTIRKAKIENGQDLLRIRREIQIMSSINHPHIIHIYEVFENSEKIVLVMQYASGGELYDYLGCHKKLPEKEARRIFRQIAAAIYYCHKNKICHRDLKLENILLDDKGNAKIADFGLSNVFDERRKLHTFCGSPLYASPEIVKGMPYSGPEVDCWSLGVLLYTMVYGAMPFDGSNFKRLVKQISEGDYYEPKLKSRASGIIRRLLAVDVSKRATIADACADEWVNEEYDHSLLQIASDMACLTPVSLNPHLAMPQIRANCSQQIMRRKDLLRSAASYKPGDYSMDTILKKNNEPSLYSSYVGSSTDSSVKRINYNYAERSQMRPSNDSSYDVKQIVSDIISSVEKANSEPLQIRNDENNGLTVNRDDPSTLNMQKALMKFYKETCESNTYNSLRTGSVFKPSPRNSNYALPNDSQFLRDPTSENVLNCSNSNYTYSKILDDTFETCLNRDIDHIPMNKLNRESTVEKFRAWRASIDKPKQNSEHILPIFDVTSVIPQRVNESMKSEKFKREFEDKEKKFTNNHFITNLDSDSYEKRNETLSIRLKENEYTGNKLSISNTYPEKINTFEKHIEKINIANDRKDVFHILNQICQQRKATSERKQRLLSEFVSENKCETDNADCSEVFDVVNNASIAETSKCVATISQLIPKEQVDKYSNQSENTLHFHSQDVHDLTQIVHKEISGGESEVLKTDSSQLSTEEICRPEEKMPINNLNVQETSENYEKCCNAEKYTEQLTLCVNRIETNYFEENDKTDHSVSTDLSTPLSNDRRKLPVANSKENGTMQDSITNADVTERCSERQYRRISRTAKKSKTRSLSVDDDERVNDLEKILRRPRKYSLCALLAATFEFEHASKLQGRRQSESFRKPPGKVEIPKSFDPSSESENSTPMEKRELILFPTITVAEGKQKIETKIEKVKNSALSMKVRRKSEASTRRKLKKYTRSCTDVMQSIGNSEIYNDTTCSLQKSLPNFADAQNGVLQNPYTSSGSSMQNKFDQVTDAHGSSTIHAEVDENENSVTETTSGIYVPISRCCRKMSFTQGESRWFESGSQHQNDQQCGIRTSESECEITTGRAADISAIPSSKITAKKSRKKSSKTQRKVDESSEKNCVERSSCSPNKEHQSTLESNESLNTSSFERDSSDNDDDDLDALFGSQLEVCESGDLWKLLKSINDGLSEQLGKAKMKHSQPAYSRSKSQDCKYGRIRQLGNKLLTRSRSKEEKPRTPVEDEKFSTDTNSDFASTFSFTSTSSKYHRNCSDDGSDFQSENPSASASSSGFFENTPRSFYQKSMKAKYYSLSNLLDSDSVLFENSLQSSVKDLNNESSGNLSLDDSISNINSSDTASALARTLSLYGTLRSKSSSKNEVSKSSLCFDESDKHHFKVDNIRNFNKIERKLLPELKSKALSDMDLSYKGLISSTESTPLLTQKDSKQSSLRFAKSLGSKLNLEPRSILIDSSGKTSISRTKEDKTPKKHRKVSFTPDSTKQRNTAHALDAVAKAQKALSESERNISDTINDESGTLLEALKTHGYKFLISQRLQENEQADEDIKIKRYSASFLRNLKNYGVSASNDGMPLNASEYLKIVYLRRLLNSMQHSYNQNDDIEYKDVYSQNDIPEYSPYIAATSNWYQMPNMWLHQNIDEMKHLNPPINRPIQNLGISPSELGYQSAQYEYKNIADEVGFDNVMINNRKQNQFQQKYYQSNKLSSAGTHHEKASGSSIEKLSIRLQALKTRCSQKPFDEPCNKHSSLDSLQNDSINPIVRKKSDERYLETNGEFQSVQDASLGEKDDDSSESVSDRIWRKSFYSRFNDTSATRRRRSLLLDTDFYADPSLSRPTKTRSSKERMIIENERNHDKVKSNLIASKFFSDELQAEGSCCTNQTINVEQNIPNTERSSDVFDQIQTEKTETRK